MNRLEKTMTLQKHLQFNNTEFEVQYSICKKTQKN
jgi:hypothetical protein